MPDFDLGLGDVSIQTIGGWLEMAEARLYSEEVESPRLSAHLILERVTGRSRAYLLAHPEGILNPQQHLAAKEMLSRRLEHEPMAYLLGEKGFRNLTLKIRPGVLIPRPETEGLVDLSVRFKPKARTVLDAGTGSGCLALSLLEEYPQSLLIGCDASESALCVARSNDAAEKVGWVRCHWLAPFRSGSFDLIVSNPPYLTRREMQPLDPQVKNYEPVEALCGGEDGCDAYRLLIPQASDRLSTKGVLLMEISPTVKDGVHRLLADSHFGEIEILRDLAGRERYAKGVKE